MPDNFPLFTDVDGVITCGQKIYNRQVVSSSYCDVGEKVPHSYERLSVSKLFSDKDSWILNTYGKRITLVSCDDQISKQRSAENGWLFLFVPKGKDKIEYVPVSNYYYVGDAMPDFHALLKAKRGFIPADGSSFLKRKCDGYSHISIIPVKSGEGVLDYVVNELIVSGSWDEQC